MKDVSNELNAVFPLMNEKDAKQIATLMKDIVVKSTQFISLAQKRDLDKTDRNVQNRYFELREILRKDLRYVLETVENSVRSEVEKKKDSLIKTQLVTDIREAALDGVEAGRLLQHKSVDVVALRAVILSMVHRGKDATEHVKDATLQKQLLQACNLILSCLEEFETNPSEQTKRASMIAGIGAWLQVLQAIQQKEF